MRTLIVLLTLAGPAVADDLTPTTNDRSNTINGDISGDLNQQKAYRYKDNNSQQPGCKKLNGNVVCKSN